MAKRMLIDALHAEETRVVITDDKQIIDFDFVSATKKQLKGNVYLAKITRVEPSLQAAFVEYGGNKQGFLPFSEIHPDYYQIPVSDRQRLMEEAEREVAEESAGEPIAEPISSEEPSAIEQLGVPTEAIAESNTAQLDYLAQPVEIPTETPLEVSETVTTVSETPADNAEQAADGEKTPEEGMETIQNEEEEIRSRPKRNYAKRYRIQEVIRRGQIVLVQVIKEERGNKGASLTTFLSLAGRYCVLMPNSPKDGGISRKIASPEDRRRLKQITAEFKFAEGMSVIIRTAGMGRTHAEIKRDYDYLVKLWNYIRETTLASNAPAMIYEESNIIKRSIRDQYTNDIDEILVEGAAAYESAKEFMQLLLPSHTPKVKLYEENTPLFYAYSVEDHLLQMHDPVVKLRSGGYIVINPTEALISIDVNSGRSTGERNIEETATKTNLEAAAEVARQLRLRDLAGLIVIDFIDMLDSRNRRAVERALKDALKIDRAKIQIGRISPFGLLEMSRQRLRPSISETNMVQCPHCAGRGYIRSNESMSIQIIRSIEKEAASGAWSGFRVVTPQAVGLHLLNSKRDLLRAIEVRHNVTVQILIDADLSLSDYNLEKMRRSQNQPVADARKQPPRRDPVITMDPLPEGEATTEELFVDPAQTAETPPRGGNRYDERGPRRGRGRRGRRGGGRERRDPLPGDVQAPEGSEPVVIDIPAPAIEETFETTAAEPTRDPRPDGRRGGRGRRPWRDRPHQETALAVERHEAVSDGTALPAFATQPAIQEPVAPPPVLESTPRDPNAPVKKGWWQKMIDLDE